MKKIIFFFSFLAIAAISNAQPPTGDAKPGEWYGDKVNPYGALNINDVVAKLNGGSEFNDVKIQAKVLEVCPKKGCWLKLELKDGTTATVKMKDYGFFLPVAAEGKIGVIDG